MNKFIILSTLVLLLISFVQSKHYQELKWNKSEELIHSEQTILFKIYLKHQNLDSLRETVKDISSPKSPNYSKYLKPEEVMDIIAPSKESTDIIMKWVQSFSPLQITNKVDVLFIKMSKRNVEKMFNIEIHKWEHPKSQYIFRSQHDPIINEKYSKHIDLITGISNFPVIQNKKNTKINEVFSNELLGSSAASSGSSSDAPVAGMSFQRILGYGETAYLTYTPVCSPNCNDKYYPVSVYVSSLNTVMNQTVQTLNITPNCSTASGYPVCGVTVNTIPYLPTSIKIVDTVLDESLTYPYPFVSTPVITPQVIKNYYGVPEGYLITSNVTQCVVEFEQQYMSTTDLETFFQQMGLPWDYDLTFIGTNNASNPGIEASLDIQYLMGIAPNSPTTFFSIFANSTVEIDDIASWAVAAFNDYPSTPLVNSLSYGMTEVNVDKYQGQGYLARSDVEFQKLALLGITIIIASGDSGSGDLGGAPMGTDNCETLHADWPSQSQYVTSVGSIYFTPLSQPICYEDVSMGGISCIDQPIGEVGVSIDYGMMWTSGGMVSNTSSLAWYQESVVSKYYTEYASLLPPSNLYNQSGRAYPDFSTVGHNLYIINDNIWMTVDGTSASAPIFAGLITILNDIRINAGLQPLGFLNPLFYQISQDFPEAFYDVTVGDNRCGIFGDPGSPTCCPFGFQATPGFDVVSGLGRPNMEVLMRVIVLY